ncbi:Acetate operon repressor [Pigmentiphaga humi]|uniref:Acetate operon repressor n=1 Tax=Pigmentiphaga humi TaxID=2478468 RepID=A0A3P4B453_9BURK|nr:IclR family transcriptional regulator [Pigmentiphaga humi]VCU70460.1 Acetate operon repressor [Pigmentiphaga humi]
MIPKQDKDSPPPSADAGSGTVSRALHLLTVLADAGGSVTVKHVADQMRLAPSTAHRLLQLLKKEGFVDTAAESRQYTIGAEFYRVAARVAGTVSPPTIAQPTLEAIANAFDETVVFGLYLPTERSLSFAARADGQQKLKYQIDMHRPLSLVWGASGKAVLAFLPEGQAREILAREGPSPASGLRPPAWEVLSAELAAIRCRGYAVSESEKLLDARGIAAPVFGPGGIVGCVCLTSPKSRMPHASIEAIGQDIAARSLALSRTLGAKLP